MKPSRGEALLPQVKKRCHKVAEIVSGKPHKRPFCDEALKTDRLLDPSKRWEPRRRPWSRPPHKLRTRRPCRGPVTRHTNVNRLTSRVPLLHTDGDFWEGTLVSDSAERPDANLVPTGALVSNRLPDVTWSGPLGQTETRGTQWAQGTACLEKRSRTSLRWGK